MDIEELNKVQVILLVLLVSFVTSIATGIVTVSLLAQAPPAVTQTVNHIIQRTVEAVTPSVGAPQTTVKETTVVVKEDELITNSIGSSFSQVGAIHDGIATSSPVTAMGVLLSGGFLIANSSSVDDTKHLVSFPATSTIFSVSLRIPEVGVAVLVPSNTLTGGMRISDADGARLGQTVIALPSATGNRVGIGSITARYTLARVGEESDTSIRAVETNITGRISLGAPLISSTGDVIGVATSISQGDGGSASTFVALSDIAPLILNVRGTSTPPTADLAE